MELGISNCGHLKQPETACSIRAIDAWAGVALASVPRAGVLHAQRVLLLYYYTGWVHFAWDAF
jgi:hypothetical protein